MSVRFSGELKYDEKKQMFSFEFNREVFETMIGIHKIPVQQAIEVLTLEFKKNLILNFSRPIQKAYDYDFFMLKQQL